MPKDPTLNKILLLGAGPIIIAQACEFDYAGTQACKALKEEGCSVVMVNPNPASIMTDSEMANATYLEPILPEIIEKIIDKEQPDAILTTMGGQTALNCALKLDERGILQKSNIRFIGASPQIIRQAEDRILFTELLERLGLDHPKSIAISQISELKMACEDVQFPILIRTSFTLGGTGSGMAQNWNELVEICQRTFQYSPGNKILLEEFLEGWKEFELEVMVDSAQNFIVVCAIENFDPMGIHTGDSITVAPAQTLTDQEYQKMRSAARLLMQVLGMTSGGCNVQFAIHPNNGRIVIIEINPRVSRSSALASKATGFPIARIASKLALGYLLQELDHPLISKSIPLTFEPVTDYVITKIPKFNFNKFPDASPKLGTQMKSVGEVMAIGSTFQESLQKAMRSLNSESQDIKNHDWFENEISEDIMTSKLKFPEHDRLFYLFQAFRQGWHLETLYELTKIDYWFLSRIQELVTIENTYSSISIKDKDLKCEDWLFLKQNGFSDYQLSKIFQVPQSQIEISRIHHHILPSFHYIDSCAGEFPITSSYLYSTYWGANEPKPLSQEKVLIIGSGPNKIGQGIEFDYCCVHASAALRELGIKSIMVNCNPETVSTDYDCCDRLYFEPLTCEDILEIIAYENPSGVLLQFSGQTGVSLSQHLSQDYRVCILGTSPAMIEIAENRFLFNQLLSKLQLPSPPHCVVNSLEQASAWISHYGFPCLVRSSFVIGGQGFRKIESQSDLLQYFSHHDSGNKILLEKYIADAIEVDVDAISDGKEVMVCGIIEQLDPSGIHSGDSLAVYPSQHLSPSILAEIESSTKIIAQILEIKGIFNIQFLVEKEKLWILEVNPRASRTVPFLSKALNLPLIKIAIQAILGTPFASLRTNYPIMKPEYTFIKQPIFSFDKFPEIDRSLGLEMKSTGEAIAIGKSFQEALQKAQAYTQANKALASWDVYSMQEVHKSHIEPIPIF